MPLPPLADASQNSPVDMPEHEFRLDVHLQILLAASQYAPVDKSLQDDAVPHLQAPDTHVSPDTLQASTVDEHLHMPFPPFADASQNSPVDIPEHELRLDVHLQTLLAASQYAPVDKSLQDDAVPHLQAPETHVSPDTLHASTVDEHLHMPFPPFADASQNSPVDIPEHELRLEVHLQTLLAASQYAPVDKSLHDDVDPHLQAPETHVSPDTLHASTVDEHLQMPFPLLADASQNSPVAIPEHEFRLDVHLQTLLAASQYAPVDKSLQDVAVPHLQAPETQVSPDTLQAATVDEHLQIPFPLFADASQNSPVDIPEHELRLDVHLQTLLAASQ